MRAIRIYIFLIAILLVVGMSPATAQSGCSSGPGTVQVDLTLPNLTSQNANLFWIDYNCVEQPYGVVAPGAIFYQTTFEGHVWVLRDDSGQVIEQFTASPSRTTILVVDNNYQPQAITSACSSAATTQQLDLTVINNTDNPVLVNLILYDCTEQTLAVVAGKNQHIQQTVIGHDWVIRLSDGTVGKQITMSATDNVVIIDAPPNTATTPAPSNQVSTPAKGSNSVAPLTGQIVFTNWDGFQYDLYTMNADGSNLLRVTDNTALNYNAKFSPDGSRMVFVSERDGNPEVYIMNSDGSSPTRLTNNNTVDAAPEFSPDGNLILFRGSSDFEGDAEIYTMSLDGSNVRQLTGNSAKDTSPQFSPDGSLIIFISDRDGNDEIYIMNADGSNAQRLTDNPADESRPRFSPDGSQILFNSDRDGDSEIFIMDVDGSNVIQITQNTTDDRAADFSPDGAWILFTNFDQSDPNDPSDLFIIQSDGTGERQLADSSVGLDFNVAPGFADWN
jgi:WD40 repeat protein